MNLELNRAIRARVRLDMPSRPQIISVPWDMPEDEVREKYGKLVDRGLIRRIVPSSRGEMKEEAERPAVLPREKVYNMPPGSVSLAVEIVGTENDNRVSQGVAGPTRIIMVEFWKFGIQTAAPTWRAGIHVTTSKSVGPFAGDISLFNTFGEPENEGFSPGPHVILVHPYESGSGNAGGWYGQAWKFPFDVVIPFDSFHINFSVQSPVAGGVHFASVHFGGVEYLPGIPMGIQNIQPRFSFGPQQFYKDYYKPAAKVPIVTYKPEPAPAAAPAPAQPTATVQKVQVVKPAAQPVEMRFKDYKAIKVYEAQGNKIIWSTVRATGSGPWGDTLAVQVIPKG